MRVEEVDVADVGLGLVAASEEGFDRDDADGVGLMVVVAAFQDYHLLHDLRGRLKKLVHRLLSVVGAELLDDGREALGHDVDLGLLD